MRRCAGIYGAFKYYFDDGGGRGPEIFRAQVVFLEWGVYLVPKKEKTWKPIRKNT